MESGDNSCLVCHEHIEFFAIGQCDHPICFKCSTRMRALCEHFYCPICRTDLPEVFFMANKEKFGEMPVRKFITNRKLKIQFENDTIRERFEKLLEHRCPKCPDRYPEKNFKALQDHMSRVHTLFYCKLCLELKIFTRERKVYNRHDLAVHRRLGDKDDTSYKGHPLCHFCEERYLDKDELYKHLRKEHFFCHFCESLGSQEFYDDYTTLREHFMTDHYLCEEGDCANAQFTNAFRSDIDYKSHMAIEHSKAQNKQQARQERTINIDINLVPRPNSRPQRGRGDHYEDRRRGGPRNQGDRSDRGGRSERYTKPTVRERQDIDRAIQASLSTMTDEDMKKVKPKPGTMSSGSSDEEFAQTEENFPALGVKSQTTAAESTQPTVTKSQPPVTSAKSTSVTTSTTDSKPSKTSLADRLAMSNSMSVQHGGLQDFPSLMQSVPRTASPNAVKPPKDKGYRKAFTAKNIEEDFPGLPTSQNKKPSEPAPRSWVQTNKPAVSDNRKTSQKKKTNNFATPSSYDVNDFPSLGAPSNKKQSERWFKPVNANSNVKDRNKLNDNAEPADSELTTDNVIDRFSPVNVPDSPKTDRTKNKKKKKKDKVTEIKSEVNQNSASLKGNSSLDDIASLLMKTEIKEAASKKIENVIESKKAEEVRRDKESKKAEEVRRDKESKKAEEVRRDNTKAKKKEDKIEKKMEKGRDESKVEECRINEPVEKVQQVPVKFTIADEEFPSLGNTNQPKKPPPGFKEGNSSQSKAPPGFNKSTAANNKPPPGFNSQNTSETVSDKVLPMSANLGNYKYAEPSGFQERNRALITTIQSICPVDSSEFTDFKQLSGEFRRSEISAGQYYKRCGDILGKDNFAEIFPELLALLPDIDKQQELLSVFMQTEGLKKDDKVLKISGKSKNAKGAWMKTQSGFLTCQTCRQVLARKDYNSHALLHNLDTDFPSLGNDVSNQKMGRTWIKT